MLFRSQTAIALFWWESSPLKWSRIARTIASKTDNNLWQNARLFALLDMALADGYIAMSASKNHYNFWRPVTALRHDHMWRSGHSRSDQRYISPMPKKCREKIVAETTRPAYLR